MAARGAAVPAGRPPGRRALVRLLIAPAAVVLIASGSAWWLLRPDPVPFEPPGQRVAVRVRDATVVLRRRGARQAEITAGRIEVSLDRSTTTFSGGPRAVFYAGTGPALEARGGRIVLDRVRREVRVDGGLRIRTARGETLAARAAVWREATGTIDLQGDVLVTFPLVVSR